MAIEKLVSAPNGVVLGYHKLFKLTSEYSVYENDTKTVCHVLSWKDFDSFEARAPIVWQWTFDNLVTIDQFSEAEVLLTEFDESPFKDGLVVNYSTPPLAQAKARKLAELSAEFHSRNDAVLQTPFGVVDGDERSKIKVTQTVAMLQALDRIDPDNVTDHIEFTLADNTQVSVTAHDLDVIGALMGGREQQLRAIRNDRRLQVNEAETVEEVEAVKWEEPVVMVPPPIVTPVVVPGQA